MAAATRKKLEDALQKVVETPPGKADSEQGRTALRLLQSGVQNASSGRNGSPEELLDGLEPKGRVLAFILEIHEKKKMYRKITVSTLRILLEQPSWAAAAVEDADLRARMPDDVKDLLGDESEEEIPEDPPEEDAAPEQAADDAARPEQPEDACSPTPQAAPEQAADNAARPEQPEDASVSTPQLAPPSGEPPSGEPSPGLPTGSVLTVLPEQEPLGQQVNIPVPSMQHIPAPSMPAAPAPARPPSDEPSPEQPTEAQAAALEPTPENPADMSFPAPAGDAPATQAAKVELPERPEGPSPDEPEHAASRAATPVPAPQWDAASVEAAAPGATLAPTPDAAKVPTKSAVGQVFAAAWKDINARKVAEAAPPERPRETRAAKKAPPEQPAGTRAPRAQVNAAPRQQPDVATAPAAQAEHAASRVAAPAPAPQWDAASAEAAAPSATLAPAPAAAKVPTKSAMGRAVAAAWKGVGKVDGAARRPQAQAARSVRGAPAGRTHASGLKLLRESQAAMEQLDYSAQDTDMASSAFEDFRKAMRMVASGPASEVNELRGLTPKDSILEFLVDLYERRRILRSRVSSVLVQLLDFEEWSTAANSDPSVRALVSTVVLPAPPTLGAKPPVATLSAFQTRDGTINLRKAAAGAATRGKLGVLLVRIRAAYNLVAARTGAAADPYARVQFAGRMRRTEPREGTHDPRWDSDPFIFDVTYTAEVAKFEVLDSDAAEEHVMGTLEISVAEATTKSGEPPMRRSLAGTARGELEVEVVFASAEGKPAEGKPASFDPPPRRGLEAAAGAPAWAAPPARPEAVAGAPAWVAPPARPEAADRKPRLTGTYWVAWLSIDPHSGRLQFYPREVCEVVERHFQNGDRGVDLGEAFYGAKVFFQPRMVQRTHRGSRDIRRVEVREPTGSFLIHVARGADWRYADDPSASGVEERRANVPEGVAVRCGATVRFA